MPEVPAVIVKDFAVPAENPLYCPLAGSFTVSDGVDTKDSVLTVHEDPVVVTVIAILVPVVADEADAVVETSVRHCVSPKIGKAKINMAIAITPIVTCSIFIFQLLTCTARRAIHKNVA